MSDPLPALRRRLGGVDATVIGLGSMIGAGLFAAFAPAAAVAGSGVLVALGIAAIIAYCNATASAQLAAQFPASGGTYLYGRELLGEWPGFVAGWSFVIGKTASLAAIALVFGAHAAPDGWEKPAAVAAVIALSAVNYRGVTRTAAVARIIVLAVLLVIGIVLVAGATGGSHSAASELAILGQSGWYGTLQAAGLLFFAFAGYARIATLGEEVRNPARTIPRAILAALGIVLVLYALVGITELVVLGPDLLARSTAPLADVVVASGWDWAGPIVRAGAALAALGSLLALLTGVSRTGLAMARFGDLPRWLSAVHPRFGVPHRAEIVVAGVVCVLVLTVDLRGVIGFSSFGVLVYYLIANVAAWTQSSLNRRYPRTLQAIGAAGCVVLVATLPLQAILAGIAIVAIGVAYRLIALRTTRARPR